MSQLSEVTFAVFLLVAAGFPLAFVLLRRVAFALVIAPLVSALITSIAATAMVAVGGAFAPWMVSVLLASWLGAAVLWQRRRHGQPLPEASTVDIMCIAIPLVLPTVLVLQPPSSWDSQMIWWMHAAFFDRGAEFTREAFTSPVLYFTHPDYPPAMSSSVTGVWTVIPGHDLYVAQFVSAALTFSAIAALAYAVRRATHRAPVWYSRLAALLATLPAWALDVRGAADGYSDIFWSAAFAAGVILVLIAPNWLERPFLPLLLLSIAALGKNEGAVAVGLAAVVVCIRERHRLVPSLRIWIPVAASVCWMLTTRAFGASSDLAAPNLTGRVAEMDVPARLKLIFDSMTPWIGVQISISLGVAALGMLFLRGRRQSLGIGSDFWVWVVLAGYLGTLVTTYVLTPNDLTWHLNTSINRTTQAILFLAVASTIVWLMVATSPKSVE